MGNNLIRDSFKFFNKVSDFIKPSYDDLSFRFKPTPTYITIGIKPNKILEIKERSIVMCGFNLKEGYILKWVKFKSRHQTPRAEIIDSIITPEVAILYINKDARKWPYTKGCDLFFKSTHFYAADGIFAQIHSKYRK